MNRLERIERLLKMAAVQTAKNAKLIAENAKWINRRTSQAAKEHDREMKEIRALIRRMRSMDAPDR